MNNLDPRSTAGDPGYAAVRRYLVYGLSLPERTLRSGVGLVGGAVRESAALLVPQAFRNSKTYSVMVQQMLDYLVEDVGGITRPGAAPSELKIENFVARKAVGNFVEMAGLATFHLSPLTILAIVSDVAYGSQTYLRELSDELKRQKVIDQNSTIDHVDDLLAAVSNASNVTADFFDTPPLSVDGLRDTILKTRAAVTTIDPTKIIPQAEIARMWNEMSALARHEGVGIFDVSSAMTLHTLNRLAKVGRGALSSVRVAGSLVNRHVFGHYQQALEEIRQAGFYAAVRTASTPYIEGVWQNFAHGRPSLTEEVVTGRLARRLWTWVRDRCRCWRGQGGGKTGEAGPVAANRAPRTPESPRAGQAE